MSDEREPGRERPTSAADRRGRRTSPSSSGAGAVTTPGKGRPTPSRGSGAPRKASPFARLVRFLREVVAELRKVIWPTRKQLVTYTIVVLVFVAFMVALVSLLDWVFGLGVEALFGA
ncbi:preprotein translocase subunit SecE [Pseudonocardia halophobica]|uniref:Protein translocase subunit SecE n=1 Tax=Pseudonocardia halophobica TaxID=29401 RepID=A0A9W6NVW2_9PSEU|nr:preprotein translocase subunit SecE [Pseudonocardia halophobica]GLL11264.1 protein translocase subunit SecE [Pseudonocardia halophobica]